MTNEEFQKVVLQELKEMKSKLSNMEIGQDEIKVRLTNVETRQDEIYQVVRAIEHSNQVGKSELDSHSIRIAKVEGKLKKVAKAYNEDIEVDEAVNL